MRSIGFVVSVVLLCVCLAACQRETQIDPVLFCSDFNKRSETVQLRESDAFLRGGDEVVLFGDPGLVRLQTNAHGAVHTAVVTGKLSDSLCAFAADAFQVLACPLSEDVPQELDAMLRSADSSVRTAETKRFQYFVFTSDGVVTAVQINRLLSASLPAQPALRP